MAHYFAYMFEGKLLSVLKSKNDGQGYVEIFPELPPDDVIAIVDALQEYIGDRDPERSGPPVVYECSLSSLPPLQWLEEHAQRYTRH